MRGFAIIVDFRLKPGGQDAFRRAVDENARASVRDEPGCRRFDVLEPAGERDRVVLYEIYADRAAFEAHKRTRHYAQFDADTSELVSAKSVIEYDLVCEGSEDRAS